LGQNLRQALVSIELNMVVLLISRYYCKSNHFFTACRVRLALTMPQQDVRLFVRASHAGILSNGYTYPQFFFTVG